MQYSQLSAIWRPWPLSRPFLLVFTALSILVVLALEFLLRQSHSHLFTSRVIPYAPTCISILLGLIWGVAVHDFKRLEPYFQLSRPTGASARSTLLLNYSYMFPLFVPYLAAKHRHTAVALSSTSLLLISLALTPALSSIFDGKTSTLTRNHAVSTAALAPTALSSGFEYLAYDRAWLSGQLPRFTTDTFALAPFAGGAVPETWRGPTTLVEGALRCAPGVPSPLVVDGVGVVGVNLVAGPTVVQYVVRELYLGYDADTQSVVDAALGSYFDRPEATPVSFMVGEWTSVGVQAGERLVYIWGPRSDVTETGIEMGFEDGGGTNWTAVVCEAGFSQQKVVATVAMESGGVLDVQREGSPAAIDSAWTRDFTTAVHTGQVGASLPPDANLTDLAMVNVTFGRTTAQFPSVDSLMKARFGATFETPADTDSAILLYIPNTSGLTAFAMYSRANGSLAGLLDPAELGKTYETAFKLMFAAAATAEMTSEGITTPGSVTVERTFRATGWTVNFKWARATQAGYGLLTAITLGLVVITWGRRSNLQEDPNNLAKAITLLSRSPDLRRRLENTEYYDPEVVSEMLSKGSARYRLTLVPEQGPQIDIVDDGGEGSELLPPLEQEKPFLADPDWILVRWAGIGFFVFFLALLCLLIFIFFYDRTHDGLPTVFTAASFGYKALFSYFPPFIATAIEPLIGALGAYYCMMGPYKLLRRQHPGSLPLVVDYDKSPPLFQFFRAVRAQDVQLFMLTIGILLANILALSLAALFTLEDQSRVVSVQVAAQGLPSIVGNFTEPAGEAYYELAASVSGVVPLANWTTPEYYVLPFTASTPHLALSAPTVALGADVSCELLPASQLITLCQYSGIEYPGCTNIAPPFPGDTGNGNMVSWIAANHTCWHIGTQGRPRTYYFQWKGPTADFFQRGCANSFFVGWAELPADPHPNATFFPFTHIDRIDAVVLYCTAGVRAAAVTARVGATTTTTADNATAALDIAGNTTALVGSFLDSLQNGIGTLWSNVDLTHEIAWFSTLMAALYPELPITGGVNSTHLPHAAHAAAAFEDVYRRVFAVSLRENAGELFSRGENRTVVGETTRALQRVRVDAAMWALSVAIVAFFLVLVAAVYWSREKDEVAPPTTLARGWALVYASGALETEAGGYELGEFRGGDGGRHWGVYPRKGFSGAKE